MHLHLRQRYTILGTARWCRHCKLVKLSRAKFDALTCIRDAYVETLNLTGLNFAVQVLSKAGCSSAWSVCPYVLHEFSHFFRVDSSVITSEVCQTTLTWSNTVGDDGASGTKLTCIWETPVPVGHGLLPQIWGTVYLHRRSRTHKMKPKENLLPTMSSP